MIFNDMKTIQSPEGIALLMENLWLRHNAGMKQSPNNIFMVELPPPTEEELAEARLNTHDISRPDDDPEELFGAWI
ncbi:MAG: hypothetical protein HDS58_01610 [Barnesiella sp.]|nr:hypothetical protein [Barnesiella sp.]